MSSATESETLFQQEEPPPSYSTIPTNQPTDAPPSYHDIMGISLIKQEIGAAKEGTSNLANMIFKICCICMGTVTCIGIGLILRATIPIALLVVGAVHLDDCDLDDRIPIWMVVHGSVYVAYVLASIFKLICCPDRKICCPNRKREGTEGTDSENKPSPMNSCVRFIETLLDLIQFVWLIVGSVWVLGKYDDWDDAGRPDCDGSSNNSDKCCNEGMFLFAFIYIIVAWSILFLMICCMCSCLCCCVVFAYTRRQKFMENLEAAREASATGEASGQA